MNNIYNCIQAYNSLLNIRYNFIIGRKGKNISFTVAFGKKDCFHLMGLQYLKDRPELIDDRGKIFDKINESIISLHQIESSDFYKKIEKRIDMLPYLEKLFDSNDMIFKYNQKNNIFSYIQAEYLLSTPYSGNDIYIFLDKNKETDKYFCRSFFPKDKKDYTSGQTSYTLLYKEKINTVTGKAEVQYNKLYDFKKISLQQVNVLKNSGVMFSMIPLNDNRAAIRYYKRDSLKINDILETLKVNTLNRNKPHR